MTLEEFLNQKAVRNAHVKHPEFSTLYVRHAMRIIRGQMMEVFDLASAEAKRPGRGAFTRLIQSLDNLDKPIFAESVWNLRLADWLLRNGFERTYPEQCFVKMPKLYNPSHESEQPERTN